MQITKNLSLKIVVLLLVVCLIFPLSKSITIKAADSSIYFEDFEDGLTTGWNVPWAGEMEN